MYMYINVAICEYTYICMYYVCIYMSIRTKMSKICVHEESSLATHSYGNFCQQIIINQNQRMNVEKIRYIHDYIPIFAYNALFPFYKGSTVAKSHALRIP